MVCIEKVLRKGILTLQTIKGGHEACGRIGLKMESVLLHFASLPSTLVPPGLWVCGLDIYFLYM